MSDHTPSDAEVIANYSERGGGAPGEIRRWLAEHDAKVRAEALREFAGVVREIAALGPQNSGLRTPDHLAEYVANYADRIEKEAGLK